MRDNFICSTRARQERTANAAQLNGYVIEAEGRRNPVSDGKVLISIAQAGGMVPLLLRDGAGNPVNVMGIAATPIRGYRQRM